MTLCISKLTTVMLTQQQKPRANGFAPDFMSLTISVLRPMAAIAITIKNLESVLNGLKNSSEIPKLKAIVVIKLAKTKNKIKNGNIFFKLTLSLDEPELFFALNNAKISVIGIMPRVRVSFTVTALSKVAEPKEYNESQVEAAAVTEEVSLIAVPANIPKASPEVVEKPINVPNVGNNKAAKTLKKNITDMDCATSSSFADITGAVAAIAEPPHIEEPTPINVAIFEGNFMTLHSIYATIKDIPIVIIIIGKDCPPVCTTTERFIPKPNKTTAYCNIFLEVKFIPLCKDFFSLKKIAIIIPIIIANTAPPITGNKLPSIHDGTLIARQNKTPFQFSFINVITQAPLGYFIINGADK